jgi:hypothetical protein
MLSLENGYVVSRKALEMAIEAPVSKFKKTNLKIYIFACVVFAVVFGYDGYLSKYKWSMRRSFYEKHVIDGKPDSTMAFNRKVPPLLVGIAVLLAGYLFLVKDKRLIAQESELVFSERFGDKERISYGSIQKIDKTYFDSKGYFVITYKNKDGTEVNRRISDRTYDNLAAIIAHLVKEIS